MQIEKDFLPKKYHQAVEAWQKRYFPDYEILLKYWDKFFPTQDKFCLCAMHDLDTSDKVAVGKRKGEDKVTQCTKMAPEEANRLLAIIKAQASTEFGSIQQHQGSIDRAQDDEEKFAVMRVMAEELRHGYQMFHLLTGDDWGKVAGQDADEFIEEVLSMTTGLHVLGAFNIEYDSFADNIVFAGIIDRVGKFQLTMQKVCAYKPMASSMAPMLEEEAFHLAAGVFPLRKWVRKAALGDVYITMGSIQHYLNKWVPRAYEMFGHEKGGQTNIDVGFKDMTNEQAMANYKAEIERMVADLNKTYVRARLPEKNGQQAKQLVEYLLEHKEEKHGISHQDLLFIPQIQYFRRRGMYAFQMFDVDGEEISDHATYLSYLQKTLPEPYMQHRDFGFYLEQLELVVSGEKTPQEAQAMMPRLTRTSYCPCSKSVRWVVEEPANGGGNGGGNGNDNGNDNGGGAS